MYSDRVLYDILVIPHYAHLPVTSKHLDTAVLVPKIKFMWSYT